MTTFRKSLSAMREDERWYKDRHGIWRYRIDMVDGLTFNQRATRQRPGWARGARTTWFYKSYVG